MTLIGVSTLMNIKEFLTLLTAWIALAGEYGSLPSRFTGYENGFTFILSHLQQITFQMCEKKTTSHLLAEIICIDAHSH